MANDDSELWKRNMWNVPLWKLMHWRNLRGINVQEHFVKSRTFQIAEKNWEDWGTFERTWRFWEEFEGFWNLSLDFLNSQVWILCGTLEMWNVPLRTFQTLLYQGKTVQSQVWTLSTIRTAGPDLPVSQRDRYGTYWKNISQNVWQERGSGLWCVV